jgi:hypothetical protein
MALTLGAYSVTAGKAECVAPAFLDFELAGAKTRNFRFDQETFLVFALVNSKSLDCASTNYGSLSVVPGYIQWRSRTKGRAMVASELLRPLTTNDQDPLSLISELSQPDDDQHDHLRLAGQLALRAAHFLAGTQRDCICRLGH